MIKHIALSIIGGFTYGLIEILYRGYTHWTMVLLGGLLFLALGNLNEHLTWDMPLLTQSILGAIIITLAELVCGLIINVYLKLNVWDYSNLPYNFLGQICLLYFFLWIPISTFGIVLDDYLRYWLWDEEKPHYKVI